MNFMEEALKEAELAFKSSEVPVGAVIVKNGKIIAAEHNRKEELNDCTAHAEILAIREASKVIKNWRLNGCHMYVTLEPCPMCAGAIASARLSKITIGTFDSYRGACGSVINLLQNDYLDYNMEINWQYSKKCSDIISDFFNRRRN